MFVGRLCALMTTVLESPVASVCHVRGGHLCEPVQAFSKVCVRVHAWLSGPESRGAVVGSGLSRLSGCGEERGLGS